jgi:hypothetical protein
LVGLFLGPGLFQYFFLSLFFGLFFGLFLLYCKQRLL